MRELWSNRYPMAILSCGLWRWAVGTAAWEREGGGPQGWLAGLWNGRMSARQQQRRGDWGVREGVAQEAAVGSRSDREASGSCAGGRRGHP